jgi:DmsE family decaheme c-type cytochrome
MKCHDAPIVEGDRTYKAATDILHTPHSVKGDERTPFAGHECEACHGPSNEHVAAHPAPGEKRPAPMVVFAGKGASAVSARNNTCLSCHENGLRMNWAGSQHDKNDVACASCHTAHATRDPVLTKATQPQKCFTCHAEQRAQALKRSHHPIKEGLVVCSDCHNPHGSFDRKLLKQETVNETCFQCHAEKRGPFLHEHAPVTDNCMNCHTPHGSPQPRLLTVRAAWLCQQCHTETQHPSTLYSGEFFDTTSTGLARLEGKSCLNCHSQIHGSNHPSGQRLTR